MTSYHRGKRDIKKEHYNMGILLTDKKKKEILKHFFKKRNGYELNLDNPKTFNEKIAWLKLYYQDPLITTCCDKYAVKDYVAKEIGEEYIVPTIAEWEDPEKIDFDALPKSFVLKVNWSSGYNIIVQDKSKLNREATIAQLKKWMKPDRNAYYQFFNWGFKHMKPVVYAEEYIEQINGQVYDYKFYAFDGKVKALFIATERFSEDAELTYNFFDRDYNPLPLSYGGKGQANPLPEKPKHYEKMIELAEKLAKPFPFVRVDFYEIGDRIMLGEMTFYSGGGMLGFNPVEWDYKLGELIKLPPKKIIDKKSIFFPIAYMSAKVSRSFKKITKKFRINFVKHKVIGKKHYIILFNKFRMPLSTEIIAGKRYVRIESIEVPFKNKDASIKEDTLPEFEYEVMTPREAYALEEKITMDMKKHYCEQKGYKQLKYFPNLDNPQTFNEKLLWLALHYKNPVMSIGCDKAASKKWVAEQIGEEYVVPAIGIYSNLNDIDFDSLPRKFVIKANNGWGANEVIVVKDKYSCNFDHIKAIAASWLYPWSFYYYNNMCITDEKPAKPLVVIEELLEQEGKDDLDDYKLYVCNGKVKFSLIVNDRNSGEQRRTFVDENFEVLPVRRAGKFSLSKPEKPANFDKMVELAEKLAGDVPFVRVDFYDVDGKIYLGEMTYTPGLFLRFNSTSADKMLGKYLDLTDVMKEFGDKH